jgi:hypothetical protein
MTATSSASQSSFCEPRGRATRAPGPTTQARGGLMKNQGFRPSVRGSGGGGRFWARAISATWSA